MDRAGRNAKSEQHRRHSKIKWQSVPTVLKIEGCADKTVSASVHETDEESNEHSIYWT